MIKIISVFILCTGFVKLHAQEKGMLDSMIQDNRQTQKVSGAFKSTRVINAHSVEMLGKKNLDVRILHRFGMINQGIKQFFGLDQASMRMGADYGITDYITVGFGRSTFRKELDAFVKIRFLQQATGYKPIPVSVIVAGGATLWTEQSFDSIQPTIGERTSYYLQLVLGKKITSALSLQASPIVLYSSRADNVGSTNTVVALGGGGRIKFTKRMAFTFDYHHVLGPKTPGYRSPLSAGIDIETGGHVFQLHFSNAVGMNERAYIAQTTDEFFNGDIRFGFNLSRLFFIGKKSKSSGVY
ncbi:MAG: hypothetical protein KDC15_02830 [Chitinophagaceae bacterium]|nr:hypothetical protein [Chitinophagaceae bacterium]